MNHPFPAINLHNLPFTSLEGSSHNLNFILLTNGKRTHDVL
ncbi:hypothetical protein MtrunA17_Chr4g0071181 [Medicago truncatula]|uniref:Uncharacterized protein n=1 Tax=Medicago truncatula TaxID=3880 RepID=A0A396IJY2_MEDTR|nr:hypothetical protein MtrunA17_Chr4g0071181 [Medicago truncatula]